MGAAGKADRANIRKQNAATASDMQKAIGRAIQIGEAKAKAVEQRARENLAHAKQSMLVEITAYIGKGKGKNLSSLGDLLASIAALSDVVAKKAEGLAPPGATLKSVFSGADVKVKNSVSKVNGL